jgi:SHS2 domain-containing protein
MGLEVTAPDWASFYRSAAEGLLALYGLPPGPRGTVKVSRSFTGDSPEDVLVAWLTELIFLVGTKRLLLSRVEVLKAGPKELRVRVHGRPARHLPLEREIKAATYYGLKVTRNRSRVKARIILDV